MKQLRKLKDSNNIDLIERLENALDGDTAISLVWHRMCYSTSRTRINIERLQRTPTEHSTEGAGCSVLGGNRRSLRKGVQPVKWSLCIVCQTANKKARLTYVMTKQISDKIVQASHLDYNLCLRLAGVIDLIAAEAKYHPPCFSTFNRSISKTKRGSANIYLAMIWLCKELHHAADKGHVIVLDDVWERYKELAEESSTMIQPCYQSRRGAFKKLQLGNVFYFYQPLDRCISERKTVLIHTKYKPTAVLQMQAEDKQEREEKLAFPKYEPNDDSFLSLVNVVLKCRGDMMETPGHRGLTVSEEDAISCIPDSLYMLLRLIVGGHASIEDDSPGRNEEHVRSRVLSVAQHLVYCVSGGKKWTPKHVGRHP